MILFSLILDPFMVRTQMIVEKKRLRDFGRKSMPLGLKTKRCAIDAAKI